MTGVLSCGLSCVGRKVFLVKFKDFVDEERKVRKKEYAEHYNSNSQVMVRKLCLC